MRRALFLATLVLAAATLAGCVEVEEQRYVVRVLGGQGARVEVPIPVDAKESIPRFVHTLRPVQGSVTHFFHETEKGPGLHVAVPPNGGSDVVLSARQVGSTPLRLTLEAGNGTYWMWASAPATVVVVLGHTREPECPEMRLEAVFTEPGWKQVRALTSKNCE